MNARNPMPCLIRAGMKPRIGARNRAPWETLHYTGSDSQLDTSDPSSNSTVFTGRPNPSTKLRRCSRI